MNSPKKELLRIEDMYKSYGDHLVLENIDLVVREGEFCSVVGPSGCGKSTLFRIILGQETTSAGQALIDGKSVGAPAPDRGIVYQKYSLFPHLTVLENVLLGRKLSNSFLDFRRDRKVFHDEAMSYLERVRLENHANKYPHELSGGMQQRVAIAQALIMKPRILMMDEPFGALDPDTREDMQVFMLELWNQQRMTIFFVTHDMGEAVFLSTRVLVLSQYYTDDRDDGVRRGARIVGDYHLPDSVFSTQAKNSPDFLNMVDEIRKIGFDPEHRRHVTQFDLKHPDAFQTLTDDESRKEKQS